MPYEDTILRELGGGFKADGLTPSHFLFDTARDRIEGRITQNRARRRIRDCWRRIHRAAEDDEQKIRVQTEGTSGMKKAVGEGSREATRRRAGQGRAQVSDFMKEESR